METAFVIVKGEDFSIAGYLAVYESQRGLVGEQGVDGRALSIFKKIFEHGRSVFREGRTYRGECASVFLHVKLELCIFCCRKSVFVLFYPCL
jgi:hypothetical protein